MTVMSDDRTHPRPVIIYVSTTSCASCRAMQPDLDGVAAEFEPRVELRSVDAAVAVDDVRHLRVKGTPTLIGVKDGAEVFRLVGRRSRIELQQIFAGIAAAEVSATGPGREDVVIRIGTGVALMAVGLATGPAWPLLAAGVVIACFGMAPLARRM